MNPKIERWIGRELDGELTGREQAELYRRVLRDPAVRDRLESERELDGSLGRALRSAVSAEETTGWLWRASGPSGGGRRGQPMTDQRVSVRAAALLALATGLAGAMIGVWGTSRTMRSMVHQQAVMSMASDGTAVAAPSPSSEVALLPRGQATESGLLFDDRTMGRSNARSRRSDPESGSALAQAKPTADRGVGPEGLLFDRPPMVADPLARRRGGPGVPGDRGDGLTAQPRPFWLDDGLSSDPGWEAARRGE